jgi:hypothetical protein
MYDLLKRVQQVSSRKSRKQVWLTRYKKQKYIEEQYILIVDRWMITFC